MALAIPNSLPQDFLSGPAPIPSLRKIDFKKEGLLEYDDLYAVVLDGIMSPEECTLLVTAAEKHGEWERAMVNVGYGLQRLDESTRKCGRIIWDNQEIMDRLWARIAQFLPELQKISGWQDVPQSKHSRIEFTRLNERMRILKYGSGEYFKRKDILKVLYLG
jgi:hypothetical protein